MKVRVTQVYEYDLIPEHYPGCSTPEEMVALDRDFEGDVGEFAELVSETYELVKLEDKAYCSNCNEEHMSSCIDSGQCTFCGTRIVQK